MNQFHKLKVQLRDEQFAKVELRTELDVLKRDILRMKADDHAIRTQAAYWERRASERLALIEDLIEVLRREHPFSVVLSAVRCLANHEGELTKLKQGIARNGQQDSRA